METSMSAITALDEEGNMVYANREVSETMETNNGVTLPREEVLPVDPAAFGAERREELMREVRRAIARGEVRADVDVDMLHYLITAMNVSIVEYCSEKYPDTLIDAVTDSVDAFTDLLKNGIGA